MLHLMPIPICIHGAQPGYTLKLKLGKVESKRYINVLNDTIYFTDFSHWSPALLGIHLEWIQSDSSTYFEVCYLSNSFSESLSYKRIYTNQHLVSNAVLGTEPESCGYKTGFLITHQFMYLQPHLHRYGYIIQCDIKLHF